MPDGRGNRRSAGDSAEQPFFARQAPRHFDRFLVGDQFHPVHHAQIQIPRNKTGPDALNLVRTGFNRLARQRLADHRTCYRFHRYRQDLLSLSPV